MKVKTWLLIDQTHENNFRVRRWLTPEDATAPGREAQPYYKEPRLAELPLDSRRARHLLKLLRRDALKVRVTDPGFEYVVHHDPQRAERLVHIITETGPMERSEVERCARAIIAP